MNKGNYILREASMEDAAIILEWRNDPVTVANSITKCGVTPEAHLKWMENVIQNPLRKLFILEVDGYPVGQLRLDLKENSIAEISYGLGADHRGKGYGRLLIEQAEEMAATLGLTELNAEVLLHNKASSDIFRMLGFEEEKKEDRYVYQKQYP